MTSDEFAETLTALAGDAEDAGLEREAILAEQDGVGVESGAGERYGGGAIGSSRARCRPSSWCPPGARPPQTGTTRVTTRPIRKRRETLRRPLKMTLIEWVPAGAMRVWPTTVVRAIPSSVKSGYTCLGAVARAKHVAAAGGENDVRRPCRESCARRSSDGSERSGGENDRGAVAKKVRLAVMVGVAVLFALAARTSHPMAASLPFEVIKGNVDIQALAGRTRSDVELYLGEAGSCYDLGNYQLPGNWNKNLVKCGYGSPTLLNKWDELQNSTTFAKMGWDLELGFYIEIFFDSSLAEEIRFHNIEARYDPSALLEVGAFWLGAPSYKDRIRISLGRRPKNHGIVLATSEICRRCSEQEKRRIFNGAPTTPTVPTRNTILPTAAVAGR